MLQYQYKMKLEKRESLSTPLVRYAHPPFYKYLGWVALSKGYHYYALF